MKRSPLRRHRRRSERSPAEIAWKAARFGSCTNCTAWGRLERHHVVQQQYVAREGGDEWDLRNSMLLGAWGVCSCHSNHTSHMRKLPLSRVPRRAFDFAVELMGKERAQDYFDRNYYDDSPADFS